MDAYLAVKAKCEQLMNDYKPREGYCNVTWDEMLCWGETAAGVEAKLECPQYVKVMNKGFAVRECDKDGYWKPNYEMNATEGWTNYTDCFKADPELARITDDLSRIQLMSDIGYGISLAALFIAVFIMLFSRRLHCKSNSLHLNLFIAFILRAIISFIKSSLFVEGVGLEKDIKRVNGGDIEFREDIVHWECKLIVTLFTYTVAASLMWIFMEGLYLHMLVYKTLFTERHGIRLYVILGWVLPLLYVIPWVLVRIYLDDEICWNADEHGYMWIIKGPIILTVLINFLFFIDIVLVLCNRMKSHRNVRGSNQQFRKLAKFALVLIPLFGVIYIVSAAYPHGLNVQADIVYLYCEMFYNSFQGLVLAILFCFLNEEVHNEIRRCWYRRRRDGFGNKSFTMTSAIRHNSSCGGVRTPAMNGRDTGAPKGYVKRETVSFKDSVSYDRRSTSGSLSGRTDGKHDYTLLGDAEQSCKLMD